MNKKLKNYAPSTLNDILNIKEKRFLYKKYLIEKYKKPLLIFTMNIPKEIKNNNLINFNFNFFANKIIYSMIPITIYKKIEYSNVGNVLYIVFDANPIKIKELFTKFDESFDIGRILDIDIYDTNNIKISRNTLRKCFICKKPAFECSRNNKHSTYEITNFIEKLLYNNFKNIITSELTKAFFNEIFVTPKPGLVDLNNNGSHKDLNLQIFEKSINTIKLHFDNIINITKEHIIDFYSKEINTKNIYNKINTYDCIICNNYIICDLKNKNTKNHILVNLPKEYNQNFYDELFIILKNYGYKIEKEMFKSTKEINTHKGALFISILILSSLTLSIYDENIYHNKNNFWKFFSVHIKKLIKTNYQISKNNSIKSPKSYGEIVYKNYKTFGPREEVYKGLPNIYKSLNYLHNLIKSYYNNHSGNFNNTKIFNGQKNKMINTFIKNNNHFANKNYINIYNKYYEILSNKNIHIYYENFTNLFIIYPNLLIYIISIINDTNILHRGKKEGLDFAKKSSLKLLKTNSIINPSLIYKLDKKYIEKNLSPGGSADMLIMTIFLHNIIDLFTNTN